MRFFRWLLSFFVNNSVPSLPPASKLDGVVATVFIRESNNSKTTLEHYVEAELIKRGAQVTLANQSAGLELVKQGGFTLLSSEAHIAFVGTLIIKNNRVMEKEVWIESLIDFQKREAVWVAKRNKWAQSFFRSTTPEPQLEERRNKLEQVPCFNFQLSYRVIGRDGTVLASGAEEEFAPVSDRSFEGELESLAENAIKSLDGINVWSKITIV